MGQRVLVLHVAAVALVLLVGGSEATTLDQCAAFAGQVHARSTQHAREGMVRHGAVKCSSVDGDAADKASCGAFDAAYGLGTVHLLIAQDPMRFCREHLLHRAQHEVAAQGVFGDDADTLVQTKFFSALAGMMAGGQQALSGNMYAVDPDQHYNQMLTKYLKNPKCKDEDDFMCQSKNAWDGMHFVINNSASPYAGVNVEPLVRQQLQMQMAHMMMHSVANMLGGL